MEILQQAAGGRGKIEPNVYPNNTLIVDLSDWHQSLAQLCPLTSNRCWPFLAEAASRTSASNAIEAQSSNSAQQATAKSDAKSELAKKSSITNKKKLTFHIPEPLLRTRAQLSPRDYDRALSVLSGDVRYQLHLLLYRRCQATWLLLTTIGCLLWPLLLTNLEWPVLAGALLGWCCLQLAGLLATGRFRRKLDEMLEKSVAQANTFFMDHKLMLGVINAGGLFMAGRAKLAIPMLYFDTFQCREHIESIISADLSRPAPATCRLLDYSKIDLPMQPLCANPVALAQSVSLVRRTLVDSHNNNNNASDSNNNNNNNTSELICSASLFPSLLISSITTTTTSPTPQQLARKIVLRYSQRWISQFDKQKLLFTDDQVRPRHLSTGKCLCQFIEEQFGNRPACSQPAATSQEAKAIPAVITATEAPVEVGRAGGQLGAAAPTPSDLEPACTKIEVPEPVEGPAALEMEAELISRSDDLIRKLRLLLELRQNELNGLDGSLFAAVHQKAATGQSLFQLPDEPTRTTTREPLQRPSVKKFFAPACGPKRPGANRSHILEIC